jgi:hypothetical protein
MNTSSAENVSLRGKGKIQMNLWLERMSGVCSASTTSSYLVTAEAAAAAAAAAAALQHSLTCSTSKHVKPRLKHLQRNCQSQLKYRL